MPQGGLAVWHIDEAASYNTEGYPGQSGWPGNGKHYRVSLLQADGRFDMEMGRNRGDAGDLYHGNGVNRLDASTTPNTDTYQSGNIADTGIEIASIGAAAGTMTFTLQIPAPGPGSCIIAGRPVRYLANPAGDYSYLYMVPRTTGVPSFGYYFQVPDSDGSLSDLLASPQLRRQVTVKVDGDENCPTSGLWRYGGVVQWSYVYGLY